MTFPRVAKVSSDKNTAQNSNFMLGDTEHDSSSINSTSEFYFGHVGAKIASSRQVCFEVFNI